MLAAVAASSSLTELLAGFGQTLEVAISGGDTVNVYWIAPVDCTITAISLYAVTAPSSAAGTYTMAASSGGNNLISTSTYNVESLTNGTLQAMTLTETSADLDLDAGDVVQLSFVSSNADLTGAGLHARIVAKGRSS